MSALRDSLKLTVAAACLSALIVADPARAHGVEEKLAQLAEADPATALTLAEEIQNAWSQSGSASADLLLERGLKALELGELQEAAEHLTALTDHAPGFAEGWVTRAAVYYRQGLLGPALSDLEQALALNPMHFEAISGLGAILEAVNRPVDAYEAYLQVKSIHPHHPEVAQALKRLEPLVKGQTL